MGNLKVTYLKFVQVIIWVDTILNHLDTRAIFYIGVKISYMVYRPKWYGNMYILKCPYLITNPQMV